MRNNAYSARNGSFLDKTEQVFTFFGSQNLAVCYLFYPVACYFTGEYDRCRNDRSGKTSASGFITSRFADTLYMKMLKQPDIDSLPRFRKCKTSYLCKENNFQLL